MVEAGGRVAERSESSNPMIASGNHTDSNNGRPYNHCSLFIIHHSFPYEVRGFAVLIDIFAISG